MTIHNANAPRLAPDDAKLIGQFVGVLRTSTYDYRPRNQVFSSLALALATQSDWPQLQSAIASLIGAPGFNDASLNAGIAVGERNVHALLLDVLLRLGRNEQAPNELRLAAWIAWDESRSAKPKS